MNSKELKKHIDRTLGSSLKCELPSYWWRNLFSLIVDKIEEDAANTKAQIDNALKKIEAYKERCFILAEYYADDYKEHNAELFTKVFAGSLNGYAPKEPIYLLTGSKYDENFTCCPNFLVDIRYDYSGDTLTSEHYIRIYDVPFEGYKFAEVEIYADGSYKLNPNFKLYYRTDGQELTEAEKESNKKVFDPFYSFGGDSSLLSRIHCYKNGEKCDYTVVAERSNRFYIQEPDGIAAVYLNNDGFSDYQNFATHLPTYYLPKAVADLTPENNEYNFTEAESREWLNLHPYGGAHRYGVRVMAPYKVGISEPLYKQCDVTHPTNGASESYYADIVEFDDTTSKVTIKRILYSIGNYTTGVKCIARFKKIVTIDGVFTPLI